MGGHRALRDVMALFRLPGTPAHPPSPRTEAVDRALRAFLSLTEGEDDEARALRALTLHMLEGHAPGAFARRGLGPTLEAAVAVLAEVPLALPEGLSPDVGMARVDAWYVRRERGLPHAPLEPHVLRSYLEHLEGGGHRLHAWLLGEMAATCGLDVRLPIPARAMRDVSRVADLYWLTHLYLLDTRYLRAAPKHPDVAAWTEEVLVAMPWVVEQGHVDLAAELVFCLQCVGEAGGGAHAALLSLLARQQQPDGRMDDAHATAGALLAFAGAEERHPFPG
ncbi:DUF6895 family protein [Archangium sp.]|uniref:DUF6895 family protein n=1 Tax=Archangium sp. TaxID=1872627 RepID=UPI002D2F13D4|nr:hypothetical protein [Archangium sp.]HYO57042.1 hypothetical protein [Archangium sp.]